MSGPYVSDNGDIWIERGSAPWPAILAEARSMADEILDYYPSGVLRYDGIQSNVRVSDEHEYPHGEDLEEPEEALDREMEVCNGCCRTITAHHFRAVEP